MSIKSVFLRRLLESSQRQILQENADDYGSENIPATVGKIGGTGS